MRQTKKFKAFTLIEMIIVMVIIGILSVVLIEAYLTISRTALRVEQEKNISEESLILTQIFQSIADEATIDYEKYASSLSGTNGYTGTLYLTGENRSGTSIYTAGEKCLELEGSFNIDENGETKNIQDYSGCYLAMKQGESGEEIRLTSQKVVVSEAMFRIIPYDSAKNYFDKEGDKIVINDIHQPAFWIFIHLYAPLYQPTGTNKIDLPLQLFFNLQYIKSGEDLY